MPIPEIRSSKARRSVLAVLIMVTYAPAIPMSLVNFFYR